MQTVPSGHRDIEGAGNNKVCAFIARDLEPTLRQVVIAAESQLARSTVKGSTNPSGPVANQQDVEEKRPLPFGSRTSNGVLFDDARRPGSPEGNPGLKNRAPGTRARLQLVNRHNSQIHEPPLYQWSDEFGLLDDDFSESAPMSVPGRMTHCIAHDMRNHLCAVYANVELMSRSKANQAEREELLEDVQSAIRSTVDILDSLLFFSRTGRTHSFCVYPLNQVIAQAVKMVRIHPDAQKVEISIADHRLLELCIDRTELSRAVYNLLLNACQAASRGLTPKRVHIALREGAGFIEIRVSDSGPGVTQAIRDIFCKPSSGAEKAEGFGVGLTIAQCAAREHGGFIELEKSTMGNTVFVLHLSNSQVRPVW